MLAGMHTPHLLPFPIKPCPNESLGLLHQTILLCEGWQWLCPSSKLSRKTLMWLHKSQLLLDILGLMNKAQNINIHACTHAPTHSCTPSRKNEMVFGQSSKLRQRSQCASWLLLEHLHGFLMVSVCTVLVLSDIGKHRSLSNPQPGSVICAFVVSYWVRCCFCELNLPRN